MSTNPEYYSILSLPKSSSDADIKRAYRKLAMQWHPDKHAADKKAEAETKFQLIAEAYDVLSDAAKRAVYDQYGYEGLRDGVPDEAGNQAGYQYGNNGQDIFSSFFGTSNPFADFGFGDATPFASKLKKAGPIKPEPIVKELACTLEELFNGCIKKLKVTRQRFQSPEGDLKEESKVLTVTIKPGWKKGTKTTFPCEGDEGPNQVPADVVFVLAESPHPRLAREGSALVFTATISLADALTDSVVQVPTLDGRTLSLPCPEVVFPGYEKRVKGEGMPVSKRAGEKGDLVIRFNIQFPNFLDEKQKKSIRSTLAGTEKAGTDSVAVEPGTEEAKAE